MPTSLRDALAAAHQLLLAPPLPLPLDGVDSARRIAAEAAGQIADYVLPRLDSVEAPLLVVVGGSTGSGKSTLTNTLVGRQVSRAGVLRPTTRAPVLVCHPSQTTWFGGDHVLPGVPRSTGPVVPDGATSLHLVTDPSLGPGTAILDAPDIDSVEIANHDLAAQLLGAADLWLFVTTAARYADAVPWTYLRRARERAVALALVVNRVPGHDAVEPIETDVRRMLADHDLRDARVFMLTEEQLDADGLLVSGASEIASWLDGLAADEDARRELVRGSLRGAIASLPARVEVVADAVAAQAEVAAQLRAVVDDAGRAAARDVGVELARGSLLRGEVLSRFTEHVGTAQWMGTLQQRIGDLRDRVRSVVTGDAGPAVAARGQLRSNLATLLVDAADGAASATVRSWQQLPGGVTVLEQHAAGPLHRVAATTVEEVEREVAAWQDAVLGLVEERAGSKVALARGLTLGVNGLGVALMMSIFASTGGITGGEVAVAGGTAAVSQAVLSAVFGDQAVRDLARDARADLDGRVLRILAGDAQRHREALADLPDEATVRAVRAVAADLTAAVVS